MEYLIEGAPVYTLDKAGSVAEALLVEDGLVKRLGRRSELAAEHPNAKRIDLEGGAVIPAFNDCHCHILRLGLELERPDLRHCRSVAEIQAALLDWAESNPDAEWIVGRNYDQNILAEGRHITADELEAVGRGKPVYLGHISRHLGVASNKALELAGIREDTPDPPDGIIVRDETGRPTGVLLEMALSLVEEALPEPSVTEMAEAILAAGRKLAQRGILAASDAFSGGWYDLDKELLAYAEALELGAPVRMTLMCSMDAVMEIGWTDLADAAPPAKHPDLRLGAIKLMADGALTSRTAALLEAYEDQDTNGVLIYPEEEIVERIVRAHRGGWQVAVHAIGDRAVKACLDGFGRAQAENPRRDARHRIEHCMMVNEELIDRMAELGIVACAQPEFIWGLCHAYRQGLGPRAERLMPYRTWQEHGVPLCFGSDQPVVSGDPLLGWRQAVERRCRDGGFLGPEEGLDPLTALRCYTNGGAYATFDDRIGSLEPGKQARFVVLSRRPEDVLDPEMRILATSADLLDQTA